MAVGNPGAVPQWTWQCGFYPAADPASAEATPRRPSRRRGRPWSGLGQYSYRSAARPTSKRGVTSRHGPRRSAAGSTEASACRPTGGRGADVDLTISAPAPRSRLPSRSPVALDQGEEPLSPSYETGLLIKAPLLGRSDHHTEVDQQHHRRIDSIAVHTHELGESMRHDLARDT